MSTKPAHVREMFGSIATRYDLANHVLSCGIDFYWRARAAEIVNAWHPHTIADLATGTGDLALVMQKKLPHAELTGVDFLPEMLELARRKGVRRVVLADAMKLPFNDASFDCVTIAFGLRNLENCSAALTEIWRVLNAKVHLLVLESALPTTPILRAAYRFYFHRATIHVGEFLKGLSNLIRRRNFAEALHESAGTPGPVARLIHAAIIRHDAPRRELRDIVQEAAQLEVPKLERFLPVLATIA